MTPDTLIGFIVSLVVRPELVLNEETKLRSGIKLAIV